MALLHRLSSFFVSILMTQQHETLLTRPHWPNTATGLHKRKVRQEASCFPSVTHQTCRPSLLRVTRCFGDVAPAAVSRQVLSPCTGAQARCSKSRVQAPVSVNRQVHRRRKAGEGEVGEAGGGERQMKGAPWGGGWPCGDNMDGTSHLLLQVTFLGWRQERLKRARGRARARDEPFRGHCAPGVIP